MAAGGWRFLRSRLLLRLTPKDERSLGRRAWPAHLAFQLNVLAKQYETSLSAALWNVSVWARRDFSCTGARTQEMQQRDSRVTISTATCSGPDARATAAHGRTRDPSSPLCDGSCKRSYDRQQALERMRGLIGFRGRLVEPDTLSLPEGPGSEGGGTGQVAAPSATGHQRLPASLELRYKKGIWKFRQERDVLPRSSFAARRIADVAAPPNKRRKPV